MAWIDWAKKFFSEPGTVIVMLTSGALGFIVGIANGVVQKRHGGWPAFFGSVATGTVIAVVIGLGMSEYIKSETLKLAIVAVCAIISDDIWAGFKTLGASFRSNPIESFFRVLDALRGRAQTPPEPPQAPAPKE